MDYSSLLDSKTKKRVLMDRFEEQKNLIQYYVDEHNADECVEVLEGVVSLMEDFIKEKNLRIVSTDDQA